MTNADRHPGLRILHLATDAFGGYGGVALYNRDVLNGLALASDIERIVSVPRVQGEPMQPIPPKVDWDTSGLGGKRAYVRAVLRRATGGERFDAIYCSHINLAPLAWLTAKITRKPWALCLYGIDAWPRNASARNRFFASRADLFIPLSNVTLERFLSWCPVDRNRCVTMHNAIHLEQFGVGEKSPALLDRYRLRDRKVIMTFGRLDPTERYKGFDEIIELMPELRAERPEIAYLIAGAGADRPRLEAKAKALGVAEHVVFTGMVEEAEKADTYRLADVYAMPSKGEGFGFVVLEAMACGVPAIGSTQDGTREAVCEGEIGQLVDPDDRAAIKRAILAAIDQPKAIPEGLNYFAFPAFAQRIQAAVQRLVRGG